MVEETGRGPAETFWRLDDGPDTPSPLPLHLAGTTAVSWVVRRIRVFESKRLIFGKARLISHKDVLFSWAYCHDKPSESFQWLSVWGVESPT